MNNWNDIKDIKLEIQTGDGLKFYPLWKPTDKSKEYNTTIFDYINLEGSYVGRKKPKSSKYTLVFWFEGYDNIRQANDFEKSADDSRAWQVKHPYYGTIIGQPLNISRNDNFLNSTEVTVEFWETIYGDGLRKSVSPINIVKNKSLNYIEISAKNYEAKVDVKSNDQKIIKENVGDFSLRYESILDEVSYDDFQSTLAKTMQSIDNIIVSPAQAIKDINTLVNFPTNVQKSVIQRINLLGEIFNDLKALLSNAKTKSNKSYFEAVAGSTISSMAVVATSLTSSEYYTRSQIQELSQRISSTYNDYMSILDESQVGMSSGADYFSISFENQNVLSDLVFESIYNLFNLAFESKQEREIITDKDYNIIILVARYLGLDELDENINLFRRINNIKNKNNFVLKKGTKIKYHV